MDEIKGKIVDAAEASQLYKTYPAKWFLMKVLGKGANGKATLLEIIEYHEDKDVLRDLLLDLDVENYRFIFMWADPEGKCDL